MKIDRNKYVRIVYHGLNYIQRNERKDIYTKQIISYTEKNFINIDTIFMVIDALLFSYLVDLYDRYNNNNNSSLLSSSSSSSLSKKKSYNEIYDDLRLCIDTCHRDGAIKDEVMKDPSKYIIYDDGIITTLQQLKSAGKKVFLLTNSLWEYTNSVMEFLVHSR